MTTERFWTLLSGVFGVSAISVLALALSAADGRLRLELQSSVVAPISPPPTREGFDEEIDRLRRLVEALKNEITKLKEAREQTAQMIAALGAPEQQSPIQPPPTGTCSRRSAAELRANRSGRTSHRFPDRR
jgi:hypothetical protein